MGEKHISHTFIDNFYEIWVKSWEDFHFKIPGCESSYEAQERFVRAVQNISGMHQGKTIAIVTHGNALGLFLNYIDSPKHIREAEKIDNSDLLRILHRESHFLWDRNSRDKRLYHIVT